MCCDFKWVMKSLKYNISQHWNGTKYMYLSTNTRYFVHYLFAILCNVILLLNYFSTGKYAFWVYLLHHYITVQITIFKIISI